MRALKLAGALWIIGGVNSFGMMIGTLGEPIIMALSASGAIVGVTIGALLIARPGPQAVRWSNVAGIAWFVAFGALTLAEIALQMDYVLSVAVHTAFGVVGALVAYSGRAAVATREVAG
jgi:hypothetical protein